MSLKLSGLNKGTLLPDLKRSVTQEHINSYASASGDFNPIHIDPEFARKSGLDGTIAHGMLTLAYISEYMVETFGEVWLSGGYLSARFKGAAYPGDTLTVGGKVTGIEKQDNSTLVECEILCQNQKDEPVISCITKIRESNNENSH